MDRPLMIKTLRSWLEGLRSGDYIQGRNHFRQDVNEVPQFCALGVLLDKNVKTPECNAEWEGRNYDGVYDFICDDTSHGFALLDDDYPFIPNKLYDWIPIKYLPEGASIKTTYPLHSDTVSITTLNDHYQLSFDQIADIIELYAIELGLVTIDELYPHKHEDQLMTV
jgi:hypothetical protein